MKRGQIYVNTDGHYVMVAELELSGCCYFCLIDLDSGYVGPVWEDEKEMLDNYKLYSETFVSLVDVVRTAEQIRQEWNIGLAEPQEDSLASMFKALKVIRGEDYELTEVEVIKYLSEGGRITRGYWKPHNHLVIQDGKVADETGAEYKMNTMQGWKRWEETC